MPLVMELKGTVVIIVDRLMYVLGDVGIRTSLGTILNHRVHTSKAVAVLVIVMNRREVLAYVEVQTQSSNM
jgi:hypothetical protein